jgi:hypothetical protein
VFERVLIFPATVFAESLAPTSIVVVSPLAVRTISSEPVVVLAVAVCAAAKALVR